MSDKKKSDIFITVEQAILEKVHEIVSSNMGYLAEPGRHFLLFRAHFQSSMHWVFVCPPREERMSPSDLRDWTLRNLQLAIASDLDLKELKIEWMAADEAVKRNFIRFVEE